ncbi:MAG TPA: NUDIX domain-containing protein [Terriglobales bacterium]|nr:NUDIX domain-containing protein [Terriglobales bacterium]
MRGRAATRLTRPAAEIVDIVDEEDVVVGVALRPHMRRHRLLHRAVYILVFNSASELLIHQRTAIKDVYPSHWDIAFGGVVGAGESYEVAAERELAEEAGLSAALEPLFELSFEDERSRVRGRAYRCVTDAPVTLQAAEVTRAEWIEATEIAARSARDPFCPDGLQVLETYLKSASLPPPF